jgi:hypothetical protein
MELAENRGKYLQLHPYRRHTSTPTHFLTEAQCALFSGLSWLSDASWRWRWNFDCGNLPAIRIRLFDDLH